MLINAVIFDLDGTLLDTLEDLTHATNHVLRTRGMDTISPAQCKKLIGNGSRMLLHRATGTEGDELERALAVYLEYYNVHRLDHTRPYDGIEPVLDELEARGLRLSVLSNKPHGSTGELIATLLPGRGFTGVLGQREGVPIKPDPTVALELSRAMGSAPDETAFVGDSGVDMATAKAAGMLAVGVTWGLRPESDLHEHGVDVVIHEPAQLLSVLD